MALGLVGELSSGRKSHVVGSWAWEQERVGSPGFSASRSLLREKTPADQEVRPAASFTTPAGPFWHLGSQALWACHIPCADPLLQPTPWMPSPVSCWSKMTDHTQTLETLQGFLRTDFDGWEGRIKAYHPGIQFHRSACVF